MPLKTGASLSILGSTSAASFAPSLAISPTPAGCRVARPITQQVVKNLLVGDDVTYERKICEMIVASRVESTLSKPEIRPHINSAYLGRGSWGVEMAARSYFGKSTKNLTLAEGAMLAGLLKGPSFFNPDRHPERAKQCFADALGRMQGRCHLRRGQRTTRWQHRRSSSPSSSGAATVAYTSSIFSAVRRSRTVWQV